MELLIILLLVVINGVFAMSELAVVSSRRARLQEMADNGSAGAKTALGLVDSPNDFLSTVQIGITLIGIVAGAFGGAALEDDLAEQLSVIPVIAPYSQGLAFVLIVGLTTYLSLVIGELVPKRLALKNPEAVAVIVAGPMKLLSRLTAPLVRLLTFSTDVLVRLLGVNSNVNASVTEGEVLAMIRHGTLTGIFHRVEPQMVENVFRLDEVHIDSLMTPRPDIVWLDVDATSDDIRNEIGGNPFAAYPVCRENIDNVMGVVEAKDLLAKLLMGETVRLRSVMHKATFVPETISAARMLETFKANGTDIALVVDEYGGTQGLITIEDVMQEIVGHLNHDDPEAVQRTDGTWLLSGTLPVYRLPELFEGFEPPEAEQGMYSTLSGFVMVRLGRIPATAESFSWNSLHFEVIDMDGNHVDKVLVKQL